MFQAPTSRSNFKVNVSNVLGLDQQRVRAQLLALALSNPSQYFQLRQQVIDAITIETVKNTYEQYWTILTTGVPNIELGGKTFAPNLPEQQVNKFALKVANAVREIAEEAVESILPMKYNDLAISSSRGVLKSRGIDI